MRKWILAFVLFALLLLPSSYAMGEGGEHGKEANKAIHGHQGQIWGKRLYFPSGIRIELIGHNVTVYSEGSLLLRISLPPGTIIFRENPDKSIVASSTIADVIVTPFPTSIAIYFRHSGSISAEFSNLKRKNPGYYSFSAGRTRGYMILIGARYEGGKIVGAEGAIVTISLLPSHGATIPSSVLSNMVGQIEIRKVKGKLFANVYIRGNVTLSTPIPVSFGMRIPIRNLSGILEISLPKNVTGRQVLILYNGLPVWRVSDPKDLTGKSEQAYWATSSNNSTLIYLKVSQRGTLEILPTNKVREAKGIGILIGSAVSAGLLFVLFRRL